MRGWFSEGLWMADVVRVDLFVEDRAHEAFVEALVRRVLREAGQETTVHSRSALGGHGRALTELEAFQKAVRGRQPGLNVPDVLIVVRDANCSTFSEIRKEIADRVDPSVFPAVAIACPDPHIERWFLADPASFRAVVGADPRLGPRKCTRDLYKRKLVEAVRRGGNPITLGGIEFALDLVEAMDFFRAGKNEPSLRHFIDDVRQATALVKGK